MSKREAESENKRQVKKRRVNRPSILVHAHEKLVNAVMESVQSFPKEMAEIVADYCGFHFLVQAVSDQEPVYPRVRWEADYLPGANLLYRIDIDFIPFYLDENIPTVFKSDDDEIEL